MKILLLSFAGTIAAFILIASMRSARHWTDWKTSSRMNNTESPAALKAEILSLGYDKLEVDFNWTATQVRVTIGSEGFNRSVTIHNYEAECATDAIAQGLIILKDSFPYDRMPMEAKNAHVKKLDETATYMISEVETTKEKQ